MVALAFVLWLPSPDSCSISAWFGVCLCAGCAAGAGLEYMRHELVATLRAGLQALERHDAVVSGGDDSLAATLDARR